MPRKKKIPTKQFLLKYGLPTALIPGIILAATLGFNWQKLIEKDPKNNPEIFATNRPDADIVSSCRSSDSEPCLPTPLLTAITRPKNFAKTKS